jgi:hypothetical protein
LGRWWGRAIRECWVIQTVLPVFSVSFGNYFWQKVKARL